MGHVLGQSSVRKHPKMAFIYGGATGTSGSASVEFEGETLIQALLTNYNSLAALTRSLIILDADGVTAYNAGGVGDAQSTLWAPTGGIALDGVYTVKLLQSAAGATGGTDYLTLFVK
jgi:hypothetical protein